MKKVTFLATAIAFFGITAIEANAQSATPATTQQPTQAEQVQEQQTPAATAQEGKKEKITEEQLPEEIKTALKDETYKDWKVSEINKVSAEAEGSAEAEVVYEVTFTNEQGQSGIARFDKTGKPASK